MESQSSLSVGFQRLLKLADFLETSVPLDQFDLKTFAGSEERPYKTDQNFCGTTACALGWATQIPEFRDLGLSLEPVEYASYPFAETEGTLFYKDPISNDRWEELRGISAAQRFFGCRWAQIDLLFMEDSYKKEDRNPLAVARRIRIFVKNDGRMDLDADY